jgi:hypothetical protein
LGAAPSLKYQDGEMEEDYETSDEVDYEDEDFETSFEDQRPIEPMKWLDEYQPAPKKPVDLETPTMPNAFTELGAMERKKLGFP